jgi:hypothetical protein
MKFTFKNCKKSIVLSIGKYVSREISVTAIWGGGVGRKKREKRHGNVREQEKREIRRKTSEK